MKKSLLIFLATAACALAHDHVEIGRESSTKLAVFSTAPSQIALCVPAGEFFSGYTPQFPGGWYANELTFTSETGSLDPAPGANLRIEFLSVSGPAGGVFAFWEAGASAPNLTMPVGWTSASGERSFAVVLGGDNHVHGRVLTASEAGTYTIVLRAVDVSGTYSPSEPFTLTLRALPTPPLSIQIQNGEARLSFVSRAGLSYEIQSSTTLAPGSWTYVDAIPPMDGNGGGLETSDPLAGRPRVFYRLIEYR